ncbi:MAG: ABC transporter permease [Planctomycetaceae bacterium]|nr:ABC transporter permease [Planctomycetaceae bacterium]
MWLSLSLLAADPSGVDVLRAAPPYIPMGMGFGLACAALFFFDYFTRAGIIARAAMKEAVRQPVFLLMTAVGCAVILINIIMPFFAFDDDTAMFIECGLATIQICALLMAVWTASTSVADEIEGKTAMTLLSKPINRQQFILGKYFGIIQSALLMVLIMTIVFVAATYFKYGYDQGEHGAQPPPLFYWKAAGTMQIPYLVKQRLLVAISVLPGVMLICFEVMVLAAVSVAISTRFPMLVNVLTCLAVFVIGHLTPVLVQSGVHPVVRFVAQVFATIFPALEHFNLQGASAQVPASYLGWAAVYCVAYSVFMLMAALISFEDRDLA